MSLVVLAGGLLSAGLVLMVTLCCSMLLVLMAASMIIIVSHMFIQSLTVYFYSLDIHSSFEERLILELK